MRLSRKERPGSDQGAGVDWSPWVVSRPDEIEETTMGCDSSLSTRSELVTRVAPKVPERPT